MQMNVSNIYVINLDRSKQRLNHFFSHVPFSNPVERMPAIDKTNLDSRYDETVFTGWEDPGGKACAMSHFLVCRDIVAKGYPLATIYEDDATFHPEHTAIANQMIAENNFDILYLGWNMRPLVLWDATPISSLCTMLAHAYILTQSGAKKICNTVESKGIWTVWDIYLSYLHHDGVLTRKFCPFVVSEQEASLGSDIWDLPPT